MGYMLFYVTILHGSVQDSHFHSKPSQQLLYALYLNKKEYFVNSGTINASGLKMLLKHFSSDLFDGGSNDKCIGVDSIYFVVEAGQVETGYNGV